MHPWHHAREGRATIRKRKKKREGWERERKGTEQKENVTIRFSTGTAYKTAVFIAREFFTAGLIAGKSDEWPICQWLQLLSAQPPTIVLPMHDKTRREWRMRTKQSFRKQSCFSQRVHCNVCIKDVTLERNYFARAIYKEAIYKQYTKKTRWKQ